MKWIGRLDKIAEERRQGGWRIFRLPSNIWTGTGFFKAVRRTLPLDTPLHSNTSWDALSDALRSGLDELHDERIVIVWPNSWVLAICNPWAYKIACDVLSTASSHSAHAELASGTVKDVLILRGFRTTA